MSKTVTWWKMNAIDALSIMIISQNLIILMILALLELSAILPAYEENIKNVILKDLTKEKT